LVLRVAKERLKLQRALKLRVPRPIANSRKMLAMPGDHGWLLIALIRTAKAGDKFFLINSYRIFV
jgi:hypothetical protein